MKKIIFTSMLMIAASLNAFGKTCENQQNALDTGYIEGYRCYSQDGKTIVSVHPQFFSSEDGLMPEDAKGFANYWEDSKFKGSFYGSFEWGTLQLNGSLKANFSGEVYSPEADFKRYDDIVLGKVVVMSGGLPTYKGRLLTLEQYARIEYLHADPDFVAGLTKKPKKMAFKSIELSDGAKASGKVKSKVKLPNGKTIEMECYEIDNGQLG